MGSPSLINGRERPKDRTVRVPILCACSMLASEAASMELPVTRSILDPTNQGVIPRMALDCMSVYEQRAIPTPGREIWFCVKERGFNIPLMGLMICGVTIARVMTGWERCAHRHTAFDRPLVPDQLDSIKAMLTVSGGVSSALLAKEQW